MAVSPRIIVLACALTCATACGAHPRAAPISTPTSLLTLAQACAQSGMPGDLSTRAKVTAWLRDVVELQGHADDDAARYLADLQKFIDRSLEAPNFGLTGLRLQTLQSPASTYCP